jgi:hypothetical protein
MPETQRQPVPRVDDSELDTAIAFLDFARASVLKKIDGVDDDRLRRPMVETGTNLLGLVHHLTEGERCWFGYHVAGREEYGDLAFAMEAPREASTAEVVAAYRDTIVASNEVVRDAGLDARVVLPIDDEFLSVRWVVAHMTSETARHAGHADILRELTDGVTGR